MNDELLQITTGPTTSLTTQGPAWVASLALHSAVICTCLGLAFAITTHAPLELAVRSGEVTIEIPTIESQQASAPQAIQIEPTIEQPVEQQLASGQPTTTQKSQLPLDLEPLPLPSESTVATNQQTTAPERMAVILPPPQRTQSSAEQIERQQPGPRQAAVAGQVGSSGPSGQDRYVMAKLNNPPPIYPQQLLAARITGRLLLELVISDQGLVTQVTIIESSGQPLFDAAAVIAARHWHGVPAMRAGQPIETIEFQEVIFSIPGR